MRRVSGNAWFDKVSVLGVQFHLCDAVQACYFLALQSERDRFEYVATPNVDHLVRLHKDFGELAPLYSQALLVTCDSRIVSILARMSGRKVSVAPGSDIARIMFDELIDPRDPVTIIGGHERTIQELARRYGLRKVNYYNPPMGFIDDEAEIQRCIDFVIANPARYCFLAVGSPQQEILASRIKETGQASGTAICVGSGIDFVAGVKPRAPVWVQKLALEWLHRLATEPRRLWRRYLVDDVKIFSLWAKELRRERDRSATAMTSEPIRLSVSAVGRRRR